MAKKSSKKSTKKTTAKKEAEEIDDFEDSEFSSAEEQMDEADLGDSEDEQSSSKSIEVEAEFSGSDDVVPMRPVDELFSEELSAQEPSVADEPYKHLSVELVSQQQNHYIFKIYYQSHGFLSLLISDLLGDRILRLQHKITSLDQPIVDIIVKDGVDIIKVLKDSAKRIKKTISKIQEQLEKVKI